jgi:hypothetical protein
MRFGTARMNDRANEYVPVRVEAVTAKTDKAALCVIDGREIWIPLAAIEDKAQPGAVGIAAWLVRKEDLLPHEGDDPPLPDPTKDASTMRRPIGIGRVSSRAFGPGTLIRVEGDKSVVYFDNDRKTRTLASRYLEAKC